MIRDTFIPPPVLPAQAPININRTMTVLLVWDHKSKSAVAKPVVVIMEPTWKAAWRSASAPVSYILEISKKVLELPDDKIGGKNKLLEKLIIEYIKENKKIYLEGFINFRIKEYKALLDKIVEVSVVSYLDLITFWKTVLINDKICSKVYIKERR